MSIVAASPIKSLSIGTITAITLVFTAWPLVASAGGAVVFQVSVIAQSTMRTGDFCTASAGLAGGTGPYEFTWNGDLWYGSNTGYGSSRGATLDDSGAYTQTLEAVDANQFYDIDVRMGLVVDPDGDECTLVP